jgi:hypothetical protein
MTRAVRQRPDCKTKKSSPSYKTRLQQQIDYQKIPSPSLGRGRGGVAKPKFLAKNPNPAVRKYRLAEKSPSKFVEGTKIVFAMN